MKLAGEVSSLSTRRAIEQCIHGLPPTTCIRIVISPTTKVQGRKKRREVDVKSVGIKAGASGSSRTLQRAEPSERRAMSRKSPTRAARSTEGVAKVLQTEDVVAARKGLEICIAEPHGRAGRAFEAGVTCETGPSLGCVRHGTQTRRVHRTQRRVRAISEEARRVSREARVRT